METRVLLREGSSIRENKFSYDKSLWKKNFFMKQTSLYERKSATMRRKFYFGKNIFQNSFLRHPKFQDLEKTKKKNIISELFLETPQIPRPLENWFFCFFWFSASPLENCFFWFFWFSARPLENLFFVFFWFSARPLENWFCWFLKKVLQMFIHMHLQRSFPLRISLKNNVLPRVWHSDKHKTL